MSNNKIIYHTIYYRYYRSFNQVFKRSLFLRDKKVKQRFFNTLLRSFVEKCVQFNLKK